MNEVALPDAFRGVRPNKGFAHLDAVGDSLSAGIGSSYGVIHYRGKVWSLRYKGTTYPFVRADDGSPINYIDVVMLQQAPVKSKSFYPKKEGSDFNEGERPLCSSLNGITPDAGVPQPQAQACAICVRNQWKTNQSGKPTRECSDYKRLAVLLSPSQTAPMFNGSPLMEPVFLRVPAASLNDLSTLGDNMGRQGFHFSSYVTRISFDPTKAHPQMKFVAQEPITSDEVTAEINTLREDPNALRIVAMDTNMTAIAAPALPSNLVPHNPPTQSAPPPPAVQVIPPQPQAAAPPPAATGFNGGFGGMMKVINPTPVQTADKPVAAPPAQQAAPLAEPVQSTPDLDALCANLLPNVN